VNGEGGKGVQQTKLKRLYETEKIKCVGGGGRKHGQCLGGEREGG